MGDRSQPFPRIQLEAQRIAQVALDQPAQKQQLVPLRRQQHEVVAVTDVVATVQLVLDELIQAVQIHVGEELAVQVADGQALA
jgi:hypothetical protein